MNISKLVRTFHDPDRRWTIHQGDVQQVLPTLSGSLYDGSLSDPPYGINFMGHGWDSAVPPLPVWKQLLRVCKPGAILLAFGGTTTFHRLACNLEDAGWQLRDTISWLRGEGMPKGQNIGKHIDGERFPDEAANWTGYSTLLKSLWEPVSVAQKPRRGTFAKNALQFGCGGMNIKGCRIGTTGGTKRGHQAPYPRLEDGREDRRNWARTGHRVEAINEGRFASNVILDEHAADEIDRQSGHSRSRRGIHRHTDSNIGNGKTMNAFRSQVDGIGGYDDEGGASRFFYVHKARDAKRKGNDHPTVKPVELCEHLARLILPPQRKSPRRLIVPFSGSGSEMLGALRAGWDHVTGIELDPHYVQIARRRLSEFDGGSAMSA